MNKEFIDAMGELEREKHIPKEVLLETIESALVSAYKKNYGTAENVRVSIDPVDGDVTVLMKKEIMPDDEVVDYMTQMSLAEAHEIDQIGRAHV